MADVRSVKDEVDDARAELARLRAARPTLAEPALLLENVLPELFAEPCTLPVPDLERLVAKGTGPLLRDEALALERAGLPARWQRLCAIVASRQVDAVALSAAERRGACDLVIWSREVLAGRPETVHSQADALGLNAGLAATLLRLTLFPVLATLGLKLMPCRQALHWQQGHCPVCGSWPLLGEYRGLEQIRFLRCGLCASAWEFPRLCCPYCGLADHRRLGYFHVEGEEGQYRATTCEECRGYVKMIATLDELSAPRLLVADLATMHLDLAASERGWLVGGGG